MNLSALLLLVFQLTAQTPSPQASISGTVLRAVSGEPLARAEIRLTRVLSEDSDSDVSFRPGQESAGLPAVQTGNDGKFLLKDLEPGQYRLTVNRNGYTQQAYGSRNSSGPGSVINLAAGEKKIDLVFRMQPGGVITGRIRDASGEPIAGYDVLLLKASYNDERQYLYQEDSTRTDDRGEYRFYWVPPGRYYVRVNPPRQDSYESRRVVVEQSILGTFYPGVLDASTASVIDLAAGAEFGAADIVVPQVTTYRVRGRLVDASTGKPPASASVAMLSKKPGLFEYGFDEGDRSEYNSRTGEFELRNVVPGSYWLSANTQNEFNSPISQDRLSGVRTGTDVFEAVFSAGGSAAQASVEVNADDVNEIVLVLAQGVTIPARIAVEGAELVSLKGWENIRISLVPEISSMRYRRSSRPTADGIERIENVSPGQYRIDVDYPVAANLYLKEVLYGRTEARSTPIEVSAQAPGSITVLLNPNGGEIEGRLTDAQSLPVSGVDIVLVPDERERSRLFKIAVTDRDGHYSFRAVTPGSYKVFSWEDLEPDQYFDKQVLSKYETQGRPVRVQESLKQSVDLKIIPTSTP